MKTTARLKAPVLSKSAMKYCASSSVIPIAQNTTAKSLSVPSVCACLAIWSEMSLCGKPAPEKIGNFWPITNVFKPSIVEIPVWINSKGESLE